MSWSEAERLIDVILTDTASPLTVALNGWDYGLSREALALADLFDLTYSANGGKRGKRYPRPFADPSAPKTLGGTQGMAPEAVHAALAHFGKPDL